MARKSGRSSRRSAPQPADELALEEVGGGMGIEAAIVITTSLFLLGAIVLVMLASGRYS